MPDASRIPKIDDERAAAVRRSQGPLDNETSAVLTRIYLARRLEYQQDYYRAKEREFINSSDAAFRAGAIIMSLTSVLAAVGTTGTAPTSLSLLTAILPAAAALVASFRSLYQWDRQAQLFKDTALGLERAKLVLPDMDQVDTDTAATVFPELVATTELVFEDEVNQWGQIALGDEDKDAETDANIAAFAREYGLDVFDSNGSLDASKLGTFKDILAVSQSRRGTGLTVEYPAVGAGGEPRSASDIAATLAQDEEHPDDGDEAEIAEDAPAPSADEDDTSKTSEAND